MRRRFVGSWFGAVGAVAQLAVAAACGSTSDDPGLSVVEAEVVTRLSDRAPGWLDSGVADAPIDGAAAGPSCVSPEGHVNPVPGRCVGVATDVALTDYRADMSDTDLHVIDTPGAVVEGRNILGCVVVRAPNVTLRNNRIECHRSRDINDSASPYLGNGPVTIESGAEGALVEHNTLVCRKRHPDTAACDYGIFLGAGIAAFNDLSGMVDGFDPRSNVSISYNYVHDFGTAYEEWREDAFPGESTHYSHADGVQLYDRGTGNVTIRGNYFRGVDEAGSREARNQGMQALLLQAASDEPVRPDIEIAHNMIEGYWPSLRIACVAGASCDIFANTIDANYADHPAVIYLVGADARTRSRCNRFTDGRPVTSANTEGGASSTEGCSPSPRP
jgi:hypothetical protein